MNLIINLGLKSIRGIVFNNKGETIYSKSHPVHTSLMREKVEQDANEWKDLLEKILGDLALNTDLSNQILNITTTTSSSCILGIDENFEPVTKVLMVSDKRSIKEVEEIKQMHSFLESNENVVTTSMVIPKALWFKKHQTELFKKVNYWVGAAEIINIFFTGKLFTDPLNATKAFHNGTNYNTRLLKECEINEDTLPQVKEIGSAFHIKPEIVNKFNLNKACKFVLTTYDAICAVIGSFNGEDNNACDVSGTVTSVRVLQEDSIKPNSPILLSQPINFLKKHIIGASNNLGGGIIEWYKQAFFQEDSSNVYFQMENEAQASSTGSNGIVFLPYLLGERAPFFSPNASGNFFGINRSSTRKDFSRAVFESTAYVTRDLIELIESNGVEVKSISVSGGLARFDTINIIKADVCNKPVYVIDDFESTSVGAFVLLSLAVGLESDFQTIIHNAVKVRKVIYPSGKNTLLYNKYFNLYKDLNLHLNPAFETHKKLINEKLQHENEIVRNL